MPDLIQNAGHPGRDIILGGRPFAEPGIYALFAAVPSPCDWFDSEADAGWRAAEGAQTFTTPEAGATFAARESAAEFRDVEAPAGWRQRKPCV